MYQGQKMVGPNVKKLSLSSIGHFCTVATNREPANPIRPIASRQEVRRLAYISIKDCAQVVYTCVIHK